MRSLLFYCEGVYCAFYLLLEGRETFKACFKSEVERYTELAFKMRGS